MENKEKNSSKRQYSELDLEEKKKLINYFDCHRVSQRSVAAKFNVSPATVCNTLKQRSKILLACKNLHNSSPIFRMQKPTNAVLDSYMFKWFQAKRQKNLAVSGKMIQLEAMRFSSKHNLESFKASDGWLCRFKTRYNIKGENLHGESGSVDMQIVGAWKQQHTDLLNEYHPRDIFNVDETGLGWKCTPKKSLVFKDEKARGMKLSKERLTILFCCSALGKKLEPIVIGKSKNPRSFKKKKIPVQYESNKTSWMTTKIFTEWLKQFDAKMQSENRKFLLLLDNAPVHPVNLNFSNIRLLFFPRNSTSVIQPLDQGIIRSFKSSYRFKLSMHLLSFKEIDAIDEASGKFNLLDAMHWISQSWEDVTIATIVNCFNHANFFKRIILKQNETSNSKELLLNQLSMKYEIPAAEYITFDDEFATSEELNEEPNEEELLQAALKECDEITEDESTEESESEETESQVEIESIHEAIDLFNRVTKYLNKYDLNGESIKALMHIRGDLSSIKANSTLKQTKLTKFFQNS